MERTQVPAQHPEAVGGGGGGQGRASGETWSCDLKLGPVGRNPGKGDYEEPEIEVSLGRECGTWAGAGGRGDTGQSDGKLAGKVETARGMTIRAPGISSLHLHLQDESPWGGTRVEALGTGL